MVESNIASRFYSFLTQDDEPRACETIPDSDCTHVPANFSRNVLNGTLTKLAEKIISPNLTLPWILSFLGAPAYLIGMLVPVKDAGSLLPQLFVSGSIRKKSIRKHYWSGAALVQSLCMLLAGLGLLYTQESWLSWAIVGLLAVFSIASGVASVAFKDVSAKTVPKGERGQMLSYRSTFGGILATVAGLALVFSVKGQGDENLYAFMFIGTAVLWFLAAVVFMFIEEKPGATAGGRTPIDEVKKGFSIIKEDTNFRNFLITRALLMAVPLLQPFYVLIGKNTANTSWSYIGFLIIISGVAQVISSPIWGRLADKSTTKLMRIASFLAIAGIVYAALFKFFDYHSFYAFLPVFFINWIAYSGARLSRKTYLVDYAPDGERPTYVSVANTVIGIFTLVAASFGLIAQFYGLYAQLLFFAALLMAAIFLSFRLKSV